MSVTLSQGFWMGKYEVTQGQWQAVMGRNHSLFRDSPQFPIEDVEWEEASEFCRKFTEQERQAGRLPSGWEYRLPTEAQWEYACRAGTTTATAFGDQLSRQQANFERTRYNLPSRESYYGNNGGYSAMVNIQAFLADRPVEVGSYAANAWGLHDMHGNAPEWCADWYDRFADSPASDPTGPSQGRERVRRGGSWSSLGQDCRSASRDGSWRGFGVRIAGFRLALGRSSQSGQ